MNKLALFSVSNNTGVSNFGKFLINQGYKILSTGGTYKTLVNDHGNDKIIKISNYTDFNEVLGGRVKTLHPKIHSGLLADNKNPEHISDMEKNNYNLINIVVVNLYPFEETVRNPNVTENEAIENIDIGGPAMVRAAAKNYYDVTVITNPDQYDDLIKELNIYKGRTSFNFREKLSEEAFSETAYYDSIISKYFL